MALPIIGDVGTENLLARLEVHWSSYENRTIETEIAGLTFVVLPEVFSPDAPVTHAMVNAIEVPAGTRVLDMGCGSGVFGIVALHRGAGHCVFADVNPAAVANTRHNVERFGLTDRAEVFESNVFAALGDRRFDLIFFNPPFVYTAAPVDSSTLGEESNLFRPGRPPPSTFFDQGYQILERFFSAARDHLTPGGEIQLAFANLGNGGALATILERHGFARELVRTETTGVSEWYVFRVRPI
jgi:methylase of polypeptide subunit release factors